MLSTRKRQQAPHPPRRERLHRKNSHNISNPPVLNYSPAIHRNWPKPLKTVVSPSFIVYGTEFQDGSQVQRITKPLKNPDSA